ncbi:MAG: sulfite exporter TauE/SafE family protein [Chitinophagaceae bacterium]|nr:sulfite exporter TauE/SafE family protein [Chitinophagaceae bacterium]HMN33324.1 sulfite exporter TauE/SafE family protein [Chitinophagaceae bacterium]
MDSAIIAGLTLGLLSNLHCIGMCGPLMLAVPISNHSSKKWIEILLYHFGRIATYAILGLILGSVGSSLSAWGFQQTVSIVSGLFILGYAIIKIFNLNLLPSSNPFNQFVSSKISTFLNKKTLSSKWILGSLNGLLPCGLVYIALAASLVYGNITKGTLHMMAFGIGTMPSLVLIMLFKHKITLTFRLKINRMVPYFLGIIGCILILRGMNLGIPYVSPKHNDHHACCEMKH